VVSAYGLLRTVWPFLGPLAGLGLLAAAFQVTLADLWGGLVSVGPFLRSVRVVYLLLAGLAFYFSYVEIRHWGVPLTILSTDIVLALNTANGDRATLTRTQRIRANREHVTGYHRSVTVDAPGEMPRESVQCHANHCAANRQSVRFEGTPSNWKLIHRFDPIPRNLLVLGLNTVLRTETIVQERAYTRETESYTFNIPQNYRLRNVTLTVFFHPQRACGMHQCQALRINASGVTEMNLEHVPPDPHGRGGPGIRLRIGRPRPGEQFALAWTYPPMQIGQLEFTAGPENTNAVL
jgi:hypothetical protein